MGYGDFNQNNNAQNKGLLAAGWRPLNRDLDVDFSNSTAEVTKIMGTEPRRITEIQVTFNMNIAVSDKNKTILEKTAMTCPVFNSLHPDIKKEVVFNWK